MNYQTQTVVSDDTGYLIEDEEFATFDKGLLEKIKADIDPRVRLAMIAGLIIAHQIEGGRLSVDGLQAGIEQLIAAGEEKNLPKSFPLAERMSELNSKIAWELSPRHRAFLQARFACLFILFSFQGIGKGLKHLIMEGARVII